MIKHIFISIVSLIFAASCTSIPPDLGVTNGQLTPCPAKPNCVNSLSSDKEHFVAPFQHTGTALEIKNGILKVLKQLPNAKATVTEEYYVRAEFSSSLLGFVDDVEFYFPDTKLTKSTIHVRSASRIGYSDFSVNRERVEQLRSLFKNAK